MKDIKGYLVTDDGELKEVIVKGDGGGSHLDAMYRLLNCRMIDCVSLPHFGIDLWVDDEFIYADREPNLELSLTAVSLGWPGRHIIKGSGVFLSVNRRTGESVSLTEEQKQHVRAAFAWASKRINEVLLEGLRTITDEQR